MRFLEPNTEADPAGVMVSFLVGFGNMIGRQPHFMVEATKHYTNEFAVLVGDTATGRKGSAQAQAFRILRLVDPEWVDHRKLSGAYPGKV